MRKILLGSELAKYESPRAKQSIWLVGPLLNQACSIIIIIIIVVINVIIVIINIIIIMLLLLLLPGTSETLQPH